MFRNKLIYKKNYFFMKHLKKFEMDFYSGEGSGSVPENPTGQKPNLTKDEVLGKIKDILNNSGELGDLFVSKVDSKKGNYLQILDNQNRSIGIYISEIDPITSSTPREPYEGI